jgi:hypothetical protein
MQTHTRAYVYPGFCRKSEIQFPLIYVNKAAEVIARLS